MSLTEAAAFLAQQWPVFPCNSEKRPITTHGLKDATQDLVEVRRMFRNPGAAMIGVPTGEASGFVVVDLDCKDGAAGLEWLAANEHRIPHTRRHRTRSGGVHLLFLDPTGRTIRNSASKLAPGVDVRGGGGYVIAPPSPGYEITDDAMPVAMPGWLLDLIDPPRVERPAPAPHIRRDDDTNGSRYGLSALDAECTAIMSAGFGAQEETLNNAGLKIGALIAGGELARGFAVSALLAAARGMASQSGRPAWGSEEIQRKVERAIQDGAARPRQAPPREHVHTIRIEVVAPEPPPREEAPDHWIGEPIEFEPERTGPKPGTAEAIWADGDEWDAAAIPERPWVVPGYLMRGSVSVLSGQGAGGKSSLVVGWSIALALGHAVGQFRPLTPMVTVNYNVEDDRFEQLRRYSAGMIAAKQPIAAIGNRVIRCGPSSIGTLFERDHATGRVYPTEAMQALEALLMNSQADVLVCDPLAELHNAEENDNTAMRAVVAAFRSLAQRLGIAVLVLHHDRKGANTPGDMDRVRGASAISGAVRVMLTLTPMTSEEAEGFGVDADQRRRHFRLDGAKSNYAVSQEAEWWKLAGYTIPNGEEIAAARPWNPPGTFGDTTHADCIAALDAIHRGTPDGNPWASAKKTGDDWAGTVLLQYGVNDTRAAAMLAAWVKAGTLTIAEGESTRRGHKRQAYFVNLHAVAEMRRHNGG